MELFKNARIFDPRQARFLSKNLNDYSFPESIKTTLKDEWKLYHDNNFFYFNYNNSLFDEKEVEEDEIIIEREFVPLENDSDEEL
ncbi:unnamed protein product [Brachionus calyciflorus]|uniref:Uncharacterized protein n=1 Tax=Brachionus calyciflorus TaxID=104777 RepID=A0A814HDU3_9BILA|nr:unnamed protein product [Brachionus calyciflorus]